MSGSAAPYKEKLLTLLSAGRDGDPSCGFEGVITIAGSRTRVLGRDVPAIFEAYALLESALASVGDGSHNLIVKRASEQAKQGVHLLPSGIKTCVIYNEAEERPHTSPPALVLLKRIGHGMLEYQAQWTSEIARSLPLMHGSGRKLGFDIKHSAGVLGLFFTEEKSYGLRYIMPDWYGAFWLDGVVEQCTAFPMMRSVFEQIPEDIDWVDSIVARIKDSGLVPIPRAWHAV